VNARRESPRTDAFIILGGLALIGWAVLNLNHHAIGYLPGDVRGELWYDVLVSLVAATFGLLAILFGTIRLIQARRQRE
jgi:hypothetical protein